MKPSTIIILCFLVFGLTTLACYDRDTDKRIAVKSKELYCAGVTRYEATKHLPMGQVEGHSNYLGEDCEQTNN